MTPDPYFHGSEDGWMVGCATIGTGAALIAFLIATCGCASTPPPPAPLPERVKSVTQYVPLYDACPAPPDLPAPSLWPLAVDALHSADEGTKWRTLEYIVRDLLAWGVDEETLLDAYRGQAPPAPAPTPRPGA